jgi:stage III sporulation protein AG
VFRRLLEQLEGSGGQGKSRIQPFRWLILLGCLGAGLMILSSFFSVQNEVVPPDSARQLHPAVDTAARKSSDKMTIHEYEAEYESQLSETLSKIVGVDDVSVMINMASSEEEVLAKDSRTQEQTTNENDRRGGTRKIEEQSEDEKVVMYRGNDGEQPIVVKRLKPVVTGVLIVAKGAENLQVKAAIIEAVQRVLDVPIHRISVLPKG